MEETPRPRIAVVMPAYNAAATLGSTYEDIPAGFADDIILVDDASVDATPEVAARLGLRVIVHPHNVGYGGNQKTCYMEALRLGADIIVMLHPDGQYDPSILPEMVAPIARGEADIVLGSRMLMPGGARAGGMPLWKIIANRFLTACENLVLRQGLSEYHTGYRAYSRRFLETIPFLRNSNGFVFDTQVLVQATAFGFRIHEVPVRTRYFKEGSSVGFRTSVRYGLGTLATLVAYILHRLRLKRSPLFMR